MTLAAIGAAWLWLIVAVTAARAAFTRKGRFLSRAFLWNLPREILRRFWNLGRRSNEPLESHLAEVLPRLLRSGYAGSEIRVGPKRGGAELVFAKVFRPGEKTAIELRLAADVLSPETACDLACERRGAELVIDCGSETATAAAMSGRVWREAFGLAPDALRCVTESGISPWGEPVTRPDQQPLSDEVGAEYELAALSERIRRREEEIVQRGEEPLLPKMSCGTQARMAGIGPALVALVAATLLSYGAAPEWTLVPAGLGGNTESLVFLVIYLFFLIPAHWFLGPWPERRNWRSWSLAARAWVYWDRVVLWSVPLAVALVWTGG